MLARFGFLDRAQESAMRRKRVAPRLKMKSSPINESRLTILGPRNMEEIGNHRVGTMPVTRRSDGPNIHIGHLRYWNRSAGFLLVSVTSSVLAAGAGAGAGASSFSSAFIVVSNILEGFSKKSSSVGAYVTGEGSHRDNFVQQRG